MSDESRIKREVTRQIGEWDKNRLEEYVRNRIKSNIDRTIDEYTYKIRDNIKSAVINVIDLLYKTGLDTQPIEEMVRARFTNEKIIEFVNRAMDYYDDDPSSAIVSDIVESALEQKRSMIQRHVCEELGIEYTEEGE